MRIGPEIKKSQVVSVPPTAPSLKACMKVSGVLDDKVRGIEAELGCKDCVQKAAE